MTGTLIGYRADGRPIHLVRGGNTPEPPPADPPTGQGVPPAPPSGQPAPAAPPVPAPPPTPGWAPPSREEWEAAQTAQNRLQQLLAQQAADEGDDGTGDADPDAEVDERQPPAPPQDRSKPPTWEDFDRAMADMRRRQQQARRRQQRQWEQADAEAKAKLAQEAALREAAEKARKEAEDQYRPATIRAAAMPVLMQAGARADRIDDLFAFIRQDELTVDGQGVSGLDQQTAALKARYPEWFTPVDPAPQQPAPRQGPPRVATGDRPPAEPGAPERTADLIARKILGAA